MNITLDVKLWICGTTDHLTDNQKAPHTIT